MTDPEQPASGLDELIPGALAGERLDRVVAMLGDRSRSSAADLIAAGEVRIDGKVIRQRSFRLEADMRLQAPGAPGAAPLPAPDATVDFGEVYADDHVIVVDKPAGLVVHPGAGRPDATLVNGLLARYPELASVGQPDRPGIVHRLDATTTGLLVVARTPDAYESLVEALAARTVERTYLAVVLGSVEDDRGVIDAPIGRSSARRTRMAVVAEGRPARTHYEVIGRRTDAPEATSVTCRLETGRTHQIRVHLAAIGHPVVGDVTYGAGASVEFARVALHARRLSFSHPDSGEWMSFDAPIPDDLTGLLHTLALNIS